MWGKGRSSESGREGSSTPERGWLELCRYRDATRDPGEMAGAPLEVRMGRFGMAAVH